MGRSGQGEKSKTEEKGEIQEAGESPALPGPGRVTNGDDIQWREVWGAGGRKKSKATRRGRGKSKRRKQKKPRTADTFVSFIALPGSTPRRRAPRK